MNASSTGSSLYSRSSTSSRLTSPMVQAKAKSKTTTSGSSSTSSTLTRTFSLREKKTPASRNATASTTNSTMFQRGSVNLNRSSLRAKPSQTSQLSVEIYENNYDDEDDASKTDRFNQVRNDYHPTASSSTPSLLSSKPPISPRISSIDDNFVSVLFRSSLAIIMLLFLN